MATRQSSYAVPEMKTHVEKNPRYLVARDQLKYASAKMMAPNYQKIARSSSVSSTTRGTAG